MVGNVALGNVDVSSFFCVRRLSAFGHGNATVNLPCGIPGDQLRRFWFWRLWAFYDAAPYWCGVPTGLADQDGSAHVQLTLIELPGYLTKRTFDVYPFADWRQVEQTEIARRLAEPLADVGVQIITEPGPGYPRDRKYEYLESGNRGQLLINLAGVLGGPEWRTEYRMTPAGRPECVLRIAYPRVGTDIPGLGITVPGAALGYRAAWDSDQMRTRTFAVGDLPTDAAEGTPRPVAVEDRPQAGMPRLDAVDDWPGTVLQTTLRERAATAATRQAAPALGMTGSPPEQLPPLAQYGPGDTVTVQATTPLLPEGLHYSGRLAQVEVNAVAGVATWTIAGDSPVAVVRETVNDKLTRIDGKLAEVFQSGELRDITLPPVELSPPVTGQVTPGNWLHGGIGWARVSEFGVLRASAPVGAAVVIEAHGLLEWRGNDVEFALSWEGGPAAHTANARVEGRSLPVPVGMAVHVAVTATVVSPGQLRGHLSCGIGPRMGNMAGGDPAVTGGAHVHGDGQHTHPTGNTANNFTLEGQTDPPAAFSQGVPTRLNIVARFGAANAAQTVQMLTTKVTYYGGAAQGQAAGEESR